MLNKMFTLLLLMTATAPVAAQVNVFACEPEWGALAGELGGDKVRVYTATHAGENPHHVQARPSLIARLHNADLAVCTGAELEAGWLPMLQRRARNPKVLNGSSGYFEATDQVQLLGIPERLDRAEGDIHGEGNPHIQLDPRRLYKVAQALSLHLQEIDPANRPLYQARLANFSARWEAAIKQWEKKAARLRGKQAIVHHMEWIYLLDWLGIQHLAALEPKPGVPPTLGHLAGLKQLAAADWIIRSPLDDPKPARWLHEQSGAPLVVLPQTVGGVDASGDLFSLFDVIIERLLGQLS